MLGFPKFLSSLKKNKVSEKVGRRNEIFPKWTGGEEKGKKGSPLVYRLGINCRDVACSPIQSES